MSDRPSLATKDKPVQEQEDDRSSSLIVHPSPNPRWFPQLRLPLISTGIFVLLGTLGLSWLAEGPVDPTDYAERTRRVLKSTP